MSAGGGPSGQDPVPPASPGRGADVPARRRPRRAVRPGAGRPDPPVDLRSADDSDVGWQGPDRDGDDERLRRDVPPHW